MTMAGDGMHDEILDLRKQVRELEVRTKALCKLVGSGGVVRWQGATNLREAEGHVRYNDEHPLHRATGVTRQLDCVIRAIGGDPTRIWPPSRI
jgi:hypothetical protein